MNDNPHEVFFLPSRKHPSRHGMRQCLPVVFDLHGFDPDRGKMTIVGAYDIPSTALPDTMFAVLTGTSLQHWIEMEVLTCVLSDAANAANAANAADASDSVLVTECAHPHVKPVVMDLEFRILSHEVMQMHRVVMNGMTYNWPQVSLLI